MKCKETHQYNPHCHPTLAPHLYAAPPAPPSPDTTARSLWGPPIYPLCKRPHCVLLGPFGRGCGGRQPPTALPLTQKALLQWRIAPGQGSDGGPGAGRGFENISRFGREKIPLTKKCFSLAPNFWGLKTQSARSSARGGRAVNLSNSP